MRTSNHNIQSDQYLKRWSNHFKKKWLSVTLFRALTTFKLEGEVTSLLESSQGEEEDNREKEKWGNFWE